MAFFFLVTEYMALIVCGRPTLHITSSEKKNTATALSSVPKNRHWHSGAWCDPEFDLLFLSAQFLCSAS